MSIGSSMICFMKFTTITITMIPTNAAIIPTIPLTNKMSNGSRFIIVVSEASRLVGSELLELELELES